MNPPADQTPRIDPAVRLAWRVGQRLSAPRADLLLRLAPARFLGRARPRLAAMGFPEHVTDATLARVRGMDQWSPAWTWAAQRFLADARQGRNLGDPLAEAQATRQAAMAYAVAAWLPAHGKELRTLRAAAAGLFARTLPVLDPATEPVVVTWRAFQLPGYLVRPPDLGGPVPLVVLLNGLSTSKEELLFWIEPLLWRGFAVLALDWPGTGETAARVAVTAECDDLSDGIRALAADDPALDPGRIAVVGVSLGGALAVRIAAADRRLTAAVAVTPPFDARSWLPLAGPLLHDYLALQAGAGHRLPILAEGFALPDAARRLRVPLLVFGGGRDLVVPPAEALRTAAAARGSTLIWYADGGHGLFDRIPVWTADAAGWLAERFEGAPEGPPG